MKSVPVLIAGGAPVGMTLACELSRRGIACMLVERNASTTRYPKMDITNARSMELLTKLRMIAQAMQLPTAFQRRENVEAGVIDCGIAHLPTSVLYSGHICDLDHTPHSACLRAVIWITANVLKST
jgi:2-polyprenyl-6-methoxyphenol hydroxylase-like FAD-dependent oxidoreductase